MKIADLTQKKNVRVKVRVPASLQKSESMKPEVSGKVVSIRKEGRITRVTVELRGGAKHEFRPQDLTLA